MNTERENNIDYGKRLRKQRIHLNLTQEEVGKKIGISERQYRRYENAESVMTSKCLAPLCLEGFDINYIIGGKSSIDTNIIEGLKRMPEKTYNDTINKLLETAKAATVTGDNLPTLEMLNKIIEYYFEHASDKVLRELPDIDFFTKYLDEI